MKIRLDKLELLCYKNPSQGSIVLEPLSMWASYVLRHYCLAALAHILRGFVMPKKLTNADIDARLAGRDVVRLGEYAGASVKIKFKCLVSSCGHEWVTLPLDVCNGKGCHRCNKVERLNNESYDASIIGRTVQRAEDFKGIHNKILFRCLTCSHEWPATPKAIRLGNGCPKCSCRIPLDNAEIDRRLSGRNILRLSDYSGNSADRMNFKCTTCERTWWTTVNSVLSGRSCTVCVGRGFNPSKPSTVYVYRISEAYCGYGITNDFKERDKAHRLAFKKHNAPAQLITTYECSGIQAQQIERLIQKTFPIVNTGIDGFKKEATHLHNLPAVLDLINNTLDTIRKLPYNV